MLYANLGNGRSMTNPLTKFRDSSTRTQTCGPTASLYVLCVMPAILNRPLASIILLCIDQTEQDLGQQMTWTDCMILTSCTID